jgi:hypothetical protein
MESLLSLLPLLDESAAVIDFTPWRLGRWRDGSDMNQREKDRKPRQHTEHKTQLKL